jgi:ferredoxin-NADP reductase
LPTDTVPIASSRINWRTARVVGTRQETPTVRTLLLDVPHWPGHYAGQHVDVRLTAEDGYQAQRSYSIASAPGAAHLELTIELLGDGEVSSYLADAVRQGDVFEVRGPIGGYFVWLPHLRRPLALIAGGSGIVPLMAMLRQRAAVRTAAAVAPARLLHSVRSADERIYHAELERLAAADHDLRVVHTLTRMQPPGWAGYQRRIDRALLQDVLWPAEAAPLIYVCGPTAMVESVATALVELGHAAPSIRTERFGPSAQWSRP